MSELVTGRKLTIEVGGIPPSSSSPNARGHWGGRYRDAKIFEAAVILLCVNARNKAMIAGMSFPFIRVRVNLTIVFAQRRRRDKDNFWARFKSGMDGIVKSGLIMDDDAEHLEPGEITFLVDPERPPLTIIDIEEVVHG